MLAELELHDMQQKAQANLSGFIKMVCLIVFVGALVFCKIAYY